MGTTYQDFLSALRLRESSGDYTLVNTLGYLGAYQFGEAALVDLGFVRDDGVYWDNDFSAGWTGKFGIDSKYEFLNSVAAQNAAADEWFPLIWRYLEAIGADDYLGQMVGGIRITASGLLAGAHLLGSGAVLNWLKSDGTLGLTDAYGTPIAEYINMFGGYQMPFDTGEASLDDIASLLTVLPDLVQTRIENTYGTDGVLLLGDDGSDDRLAGNWLRDVISGGGGDDTLLGWRGSDALLGGDGSDTLRGGDGYDLLVGGDGNDLLQGDAGNDVIYGNAGLDTLQGEFGDDVLFGGTGDDTLYGGPDNDRLFGGDDNDTLAGHAGNDRLFGGDGTDLLLGGTGNDWVFGEAGNDALAGGFGRDVISGGTGNDTLYGGGHADLFIFADGFGHDSVQDFALAGGDRIALVGVASISGFDDLIANHAVQDGDNVVITTDGGETLTLVGVLLGELEANDFVF